MAEPWGVLSQDGGRVTLYEVRGADIAVRDFADVETAEARAGVMPHRLCRLAAAPETEVPAALLPGACGTIGALRQRAPLGLLPAPVRILIAGALASRPDWDGIVCLPDAEQTFWVHVSAREIVSFQAAATGRLAAAMGAVAGAADHAALGDTLARPERLAVDLNSAAIAGDGAALWGHLIGAELAAMRPYWLGQQVMIVGAGSPYDAALSAQGVQASAIERAEAWRAGLSALGAALDMAE